jgi:hypothetical protein
MKKQTKWTWAAVAVAMFLPGSLLQVLTSQTIPNGKPARAEGAADASKARDAIEQKIWDLLDDPKAVYVSLPDADFRSLGKDFDLPDGGKTATELALAAPGAAFDPRDLAKISAQKLGYKADWVVERFQRYNLDWDIGALRLTSLNPEASRYPWLVIVNGGAANFYEFYIDLKNRPGWAQYLAQKLNVLIVTIPGNFKYGGWKEPIQSLKRQPAYLLDRELSMDEYEVRNCLLTNNVILQGVKALIVNHTAGDAFIIGHSTSGEVALLANEDPELRARMKGRFLGWGSGGPARLDRIRQAREPESGGIRSSAGTLGKPAPLHILARRDPESYSRGYSGWLNPLYEAGMSHYQIAERWLEAEGRRRANFKQQLQNIEHGGGIDEKGRVEVEIEAILKKTGNRWGVNLEDVSKDLFSSHYTRMDGYTQMVWTVAHYDRNHWVPEKPMESIEVFVANEYRRKNPDAKIRLMAWDPVMTHYGHLELPRELASATYSVVRWFFK